MANHLACHILPRENPGTWRPTLSRLRESWHLFDGLKVIAVAGDHDTVPVDEVSGRLPHDAEIIEVSNDKSLREVASWVPMMQRILGESRPGDRLLWCHGKASTHGPDSPCQSWAELMWTVMLDYHDLAHRALDDGYEIAGCLRRRQRFGLEPDNWHYSGSFFWANVDSVSRRPWRDIDQIWFGVESWPGKHFTLAQSACVFLDHCYDMYDVGYWRTVVMPQWEEFKQRAALIRRTVRC